MKVSLVQALQFIRHEVEPSAQELGLHVALTGSLLTVGESRNDVDLWVFRHDNRSTSRSDVEELVRRLGYRRLGAKDFGARSVVKAQRRSRHVVDFIFQRALD